MCVCVHVHVEVVRGVGSAGADAGAGPGLGVSFAGNSARVVGRRALFLLGCLVRGSGPGASWVGAAKTQTPDTVGGPGGARVGCGAGLIPLLRPVLLLRHTPSLGPSPGHGDSIISHKRITGWG
jgi:hypothetical protein